MALIYSLVARDNVVLAEHADSDGNFPTVTRLLLCRLPTNRQRMSYIYGRYVFHYIIENGLSFLTMADESIGFTLPFAFLDEVKQQFFAMYGSKGESAIALSMQNSFERVLADLMDRFNSREAIGHLGHLRVQIDGIHNVMIDNIDKILQRGERIDLLVDRTEQLNQESITFRRQARRYKSKLWWRNMRRIALVISILTVIGVIIGMISCGGVTFPTCRS